MFPLKFTKMHALGNDFVILDSINSKITLTAPQIRAICDRKLGIGCDQLLIIEAPIHQNHAEFIFRIFNQDGSEVAQCGNGARCAIQFLAKYHNLAQQEIKLCTFNSTIVGKQIDQDNVIVNMGAPEFNPEKIPFSHTQTATMLYEVHYQGDHIIGGALSIGNPHFIIVVDKLKQLMNHAHLDHLVNLVLRSNLFPEGVNVSFCYIQTRNEIIIRTFERGSGWTQSCGSGASASVAHGINHGLLDNEVNVNTPGGNLKVQWNKGQNLFLQGPVCEVFSGILTNIVSLE